MSGPLDGVLVADFSRVLAGPYSTMFLADLGATVIKVERPGTGDDTRLWGPPWTERSSSYFESVNRSKLSLVLDLTDPDDVAAARTLAARADVMIENFRAGTLDRYALDYDAVRSANPGIVYASITGFGSGLGAELPGYDFVAQAVGGLMSITGAVGGEPQKVGVALVDVLTGKDATIGILSALYERSRTGTGRRVEVNLLSSTIGALVNQVQGYLATGRPPESMGNRHPSIAPYELLRCRDGFLAIACGNDAQFRRLAGSLGLQDLADDARYLTNALRVQHREVLVRDLEVRLLEDSTEHWEKVFLGSGVAAGRVGDIASAIDLAESLGLEPTFSVGPQHSRQVRNPIILSEHDPRPPQPPPELGEHDQLVRDWLASTDPLTPLPIPEEKTP